MNIFFINAGKRIELISSFSKAQVKISPGLIWGSDPNPIAPALQIVDRIKIFKAKLDSNSFINELIDFIKKQEIDLIVPTIDPDLKRLSKWKYKINKHSPRTIILSSKPELINIFSNKIKSKIVFNKYKLKTPKRYDLSDKNIKFPLIIKPAIGSASKGLKIVNTKRELSNNNFKNKDTIVEELIIGEEYTVDVLLDFNSKPLIAIPRKRIKVEEGEVVQAKVKRNKTLEGLCLNFCSKIGLIGPVTMQLIKSHNNKYFAIELNPRMGGGLPLSINAGANWPEYILKMCKSYEVKVQDKISNNVYMSRFHQTFVIPKNKNKFPEWSSRYLSKNVIFDLDDTLYPERDFVFSAYREVVKIIWRDFKVDIESELKKNFLDGKRGDLFTAVLKKMNINLEETYVRSKLVKAYRNAKVQLHPFIEVEDVLRKLKKNGHNIVLLSDGIHQVQKRKLKSLGLRKYFDLCIFTDEIDGKNSWKPSPIGFKFVLKKLSIEAKDSIYVGDNPLKDFTAPISLGMKAIRILRPLSEYSNTEIISAQKNYVYTISSLNELIDKINY